MTNKALYRSLLAFVAMTALYSGLWFGCQYFLVYQLDAWRNRAEAQQLYVTYKSKHSHGFPSLHRLKLEQTSMTHLASQTTLVVPELNIYLMPWTWNTFGFHAQPIDAGGGEYMPLQLLSTKIGGIYDLAYIEGQAAKEKGRYRFELQSQIVDGPEFQLNGHVKLHKGWPSSGHATLRIRSISKLQSILSSRFPLTENQNLVMQFALQSFRVQGSEIIDIPLELKNDTLFAGPFPIAHIPKAYF